MGYTECVGDWAFVSMQRVVLERHGTESCGPQPRYSQTTHPDGEARIMIRL